MNATMIKGERSKLLAVAVVIAMVACALVAFMPSADAETTDGTEMVIEISETDGSTVFSKNGSTYTPSTSGSDIYLVDVSELTGVDKVIVNMSGGSITSLGVVRVTASDYDGDIEFNMTGGSITSLYVTYTSGWSGAEPRPTWDSPRHGANTITMNVSGGYIGNIQPSIDLIEIDTFEVNISEDADIGTLRTAGSNGKIGDITINMTGGHVVYTTAIRTEAETLTYNLTGGSIDNLTIGADAEGGQWTGGDCNTGYITGNIILNIAEAVETDRIILGIGAVNMPTESWSSSATLGTMDSSSKLTIDAPGKTVLIQDSYYNEDLSKVTMYYYDINGTVLSDVGTYGSYEGKNVFTAQKEIVVIDGTLSMPEGAKYSGKITFGDEDTNSVTFTNVVAGEDGIELSMGSVRISGTIASDATITASGEVVIDGVVVSGEGSGITIETVDDGTSTITINDLTVEEGATLDIQTNVTVKKLENNGTISVADNADVVGIDNISGSGIRYEDGGSTAYVNTYDDLDQVVRNELNVTKVYLMSSVSAPSTKGITRLNATAEQTVTIYLGDGTAPVTLDMASAILNLQNVIVDVPAGSQLTVSNAIKYAGLDHIVTHQDSKIDVQGAILYVNSGNDGDTARQNYLSVAEGSQYNVDGSWFKVYHGTTTGLRDVQYGFALDLEYDGIPNAGLISGFEAATLDNYFTQTEPPTGTLMTYSEVPKRDKDKIDMGDLTVDDFSKDTTCTSAGYYILQVTIPLTSTTGVQFYDYVVFEVTKATADITISDETWYYGSPDVPTVTYKDVDGDAFSAYIAALGENTDDLVFTITKDGETIKTLTYSEFVVSNLNLDVGTYTVTADFPAKNANYNPVDGVTSTITVEPPKATVDVVELPPYFEGENGTLIYDYIYGAEPKEFLLNGQYEVTEDESNDMMFYIAGTAFYIADVNAIAPDSKFPDGEDSGYFIPVAIMNNNTYDVTVTMPGNGNPITLVPGDGVVTLVYVGDLDGTTIEFPVSAVNYEDQTLVVDYSKVYAEITSGYEESADDAKAGMTEQGQGRENVADRTMWMVYDSKDATNITQYLFFGDAPESVDDFAGSSIYTETYADPASVAVWYFSFQENQPSYTLGGTVTKALTPGDYKPGMYTMVAVDQDGNIIATATEYIAGVSGSGYDENAETVFDDMTGAGVDWSKEEGWTEDSDYSDFVAPSTMWIVWYNGQEYTGDVTATVYYGGAEFFSQSYDSWKSEGLNKWYFSDNSQWGEVDKDFQPGKYTIEITVDGIEDPIAEATVYVPGVVDIGFSEDGAEAQGDMNEYDGVDISDAGESKNVMWMVWYGQGYTETVTANLYYADDLNNAIYTQNSGTIKDWLDAGIHTWYFSFDDQNLELEYGKYTMQIVVGDQIIATDDITIYGDTVNVFLNEDPVDGVEEYDRDFAWGIDTPFYLPESGNKDWTIDYWYATDANGVVHEFAPGSVADLRDIVDEDMNVEFIAHYTSGTGTGGEEPSQRDVYSVEATIEGTTLTMTASSAQVDNFINPVGGVFYYRITVQSGDNVYTLNVMSQKIYSGSTSSTDTRTIDLLESIDGLTSLNGARVSVQFLYDYGPIHYGSNIVEFGQISTVDIVDSGLGETAENTSAAIEQIYTENGIDKKVPTDIAPETVFAVFEADAGSYVMTMQSMVDGTIVYQETLSFTDGGYHLWYFSLAEGQPSWNPETENVDVALVEGAVVEGNSYGLFIDGVLIGTIIA